MPGTGFVNGVMIANDVNFTRTTEAATMNTDGYLLIGSSGTPSIVAGPLSAGTGISITNGSGSISIAASGGGFTWTKVSSATPLVAGNGYITNNGAGVTFTLPATAAIGDTFRVVRDTGAWTIAQNAGQKINIGMVSTTVGIGGSLVSLQDGDSVELLCTTVDTEFTIISDKGNYTVN
jgi:hypothetical protein